MTSSIEELSAAVDRLTEMVRDQGRSLDALQEQVAPLTATSLQLGGSGESGILTVLDDRSHPVATISAAADGASNVLVDLQVRSPGGDLVSFAMEQPVGMTITDSDGSKHTVISGGSVTVGADGVGGSIRVLDESGQPTALLSNSEPNLLANLVINGSDGSSFTVDNEHADGFTMTDGNGVPHTRLAAGQLTLGSVDPHGSTNPVGGSITLNSGDPLAPTVVLDSSGELTLGAGGEASYDGYHGKINLVSANTGAASIVLDGSVGDIHLLNADCAEEFECVDTAGSYPEPGDIVCVDSSGRIRLSTASQDPVIGVVAGAGCYRSALVLDHQPEASGVRRPVALLGKTYCKVDGRDAPIAPGDLIAASDLPGTGRRADLGWAHAVVGRALASAAGMAVIPIVVSQR